jgi:threonine/homoserine/homoserine lactone efflux protein
MITVEALVTFLTASVLLGLAPGPDNIFVAAQSAIHGRHAGIFVVLGLCTGLVVHTVAVAFGVAVIFQTSAVAFSVLKIAGAIYLVYLAWMAFRSPGDEMQGHQAGDVNLSGLYRRGVIMNITNPKVSIFFLAFMPQFADPSRGSVTLQLLAFGGLFICSTLLVFGSIALLAGTLGQWVSGSTRAQKVLNRIAGVVFLGLAIKLATAER